jgi:hypothetical protein
MVVFGPVLDETGSWGLGVVESAEEDALRTIAQTDPVVTTRTATIEMGWSEHFSARASVRHRFCVSIVECRKGNGRRSGDVSVKGDRAVVDCGAVAVCDEVGWVTIGEGDEPTYLIATTSPAIPTTMTSAATSIRNRRLGARGTLRRSLACSLS